MLFCAVEQVYLDLHPDTLKLRYGL